MSQDLEAAKAAFLHLCQEYAELGTTIHFCAATISNAENAKFETPVEQIAATFGRVAIDFVQFGEAMKVLGVKLDEIGGEPVLEHPGQAAQHTGN